MKVTIEHFRGTLGLRINISRTKSIRYSTGIKITDQEWKDERRKGFKKAIPASELADKAVRVLGLMGVSNFDLSEFKRLMAMPINGNRPIVVIMEKYLKDKKLQGKSSVTTISISTTLVHVRKFVNDNPEFSDIDAWTDKTLTAFNRHISNLSDTTRRIYLINIRTLFNHLISEEVLQKSPFRKFKLPRSKAHWSPYTDQQMKTLLSLKPKTEAHKKSHAWFRLMYYTGGSDLKDLLIMTWRQVKDGNLHIIRAKTMNSSDSSQKLIPITGEVEKAFNELRTERRGDGDYVFRLTARGSDEDERRYVHKCNQAILANMNTMLGKDSGFKFVIKRIRPTVAVLAAEIGGVAYAQKLLMHSNISQTSTYLANRPQSMFIENHKRFEETTKNLLQGDSDPDSKK